ncbi:uncharacterized protein PAE49_004486 isoform 6-T11 [Odontesthes bonariensis]
MVCTCMVPGCSASTRKIHGVSFHRLPKELDLCKKWLRAINNPKFGEDTAIEALKNLTVCSLHFKPEDFEPNPLGVKRPALVKTAIPSILPDDVDEQPGTSGTASSAKRICLEELQKKNATCQRLPRQEEQTRSTQSENKENRVQADEDEEFNTSLSVGDGHYMVDLGRYVHLLGVDRR